MIEKVALTADVTDPDETCLVRFLLAKGYFAAEIKHRSSSFDRGSIDGAMRAVGVIEHGHWDRPLLGNPNADRGWGHAR